MHTGTAATGTMCVLAAAVLWGTTGTAAALAPAVGALAIGASAMGIGGLLQGAAAARAVWSGRHGLVTQWRLLMVSALAVAVYPLAFYSSMRLAGVAIGTVVSIGSAPAVAGLIERFIDGRSLSRRWAVGAGVGLLGIVLLAAARSSDTGPAAGPRPLLGIALGVVAGATYALYSWGAARMMPTVGTRAVLGSVFGLGGILLLPVLFATGAPIVAESRSLAVVAYLAIVPMFAGYLLFGRGLAELPASTATTLTLLEPAVAAVCAVVVLGERLPLPGWLGVALLFAGLAVLTVPGRRGRPRSVVGGDGSPDSFGDSPAVGFVDRVAGEQRPHIDRREQQLESRRGVDAGA